jgi:hypothetical protein
MKIFSCAELSISHSDLVDLRSRGQLNLGLDRMLASRLSATGFITSSSEISGIRAAYHFFTWGPVAAFIWTIYLSFVSSWWWFIPGLFGMLFIQQVNLKSNAQNICDAACRDSNLYYELMMQGVWGYQIEETAAEQFLTPKTHRT